MLPKVCAWITVITFTKIYWISPMHSNVTIKNVSWPHFSWATLYLFWWYWRYSLAVYDVFLNWQRHIFLFMFPRFQHNQCLAFVWFSWLTAYSTHVADSVSIVFILWLFSWCFNCSLIWPDFLFQWKCDDNKMFQEWVRFTDSTCW